LTGLRARPLEFAYRPRPDITPAERAALAPLRDRRTLPAADYYTMGSEGRHLLTGPALRDEMRRN
jgi:hypothetical protein